MGGNWTFVMASVNVSNRLVLVKDGRGSPPGADLDVPGATGGKRFVALWSEVMGEGDDADSTMLEKPGMKTRSEKTSHTIAIYIYDGVEPIDIGGSYGVFSMARRILPDFEFFTVAETLDPVVLSGGLTVLPDHDFPGCPSFAALVVCGGPGWKDQRCREPVLEFLRRRGPDTVTASICTGALILAAAGVLDGHEATTRRMGIGDEISPLQFLGEAHPAVTPVEARIVDCGAVVTGGGVSLAIDLSLHLIEKLWGEEAARETARVIEYQAAWEANQAALATFV